MHGAAPSLRNISDWHFALLHRWVTLQPSHPRVIAHSLEKIVPAGFHLRVESMHRTTHCRSVWFLSSSISKVVGQQRHAGIRHSSIKSSIKAGDVASHDDKLGTCRTSNVPASSPATTTRMAGSLPLPPSSVSCLPVKEEWLQVLAFLGESRSKADPKEKATTSKLTVGLPLSSQSRPVPRQLVFCLGATCGHLEGHFISTSP